MTSTDLLTTGVIAALLETAARLYEMNAALGVVIVCVAFATTIEVMMATTVAMRMTPGRENFWIRILIAFILFSFLLCLVFLCVVFFVYGFSCRAWVLTSRGISASWSFDRFATSSRGCPDENVAVQKRQPESSAHREEDGKQLHSALS